MESYDTLKSIGPNIWCLDGEWQDTTFRRRMTVIRLENGELVIHSAIRLKDSDYQMLDALGKVRWVIAPNRFHGSESEYYFKRYPNAQPFNATAFESELQSHTVQGTRLLEEVVFFHVPSKTLIVTDLIFNMVGQFKGTEEKLMRWNQIADRIGCSRIFRWVFLRNKDEFKKSYLQILRWDFNQIVMSHGKIIPANGKEIFKRGFDTISGLND